MADGSVDAQRRRRLILFGAVGVLAIVVVAVVIAVAGGGSSSKKTGGAKASPPASLKSVSAVTAEFNGVPQNGNTLGSPSAKATLMVFADLQCPFCAEWENGALPTIVDQYVRPGKLMVVFQPIAIIGNDSIIGARGAASAAQQNKLFDWAALVYHNQGKEQSGYMNQAFVRKIAAGVPGLDATKFVAQLKAAPVNKLLNDAQALATSGHVSGTPAFFVAKRGQGLKQFQTPALTAAAFKSELDALTR